jgi:4'-phosphopantetheinyl transferase
MIETYIIEISRDIEKNDFDKLISFVSEKKKEQIMRFHKFEDAQRSLIGEILARYAICKRMGCKIKDLSFYTNDYGKPMLHDNPMIHFNVSHSGKWVVCVVGGNPSGIDVEEIKPIDITIAERFFTQNEYCAILSQPESSRIKYFYMLWTLKESYIKAIGKGLSIPLNSFEIILNNSDISAVIGGKTTSYSFHQSFLSNTSVYATCFLKENSYFENRIHLESLLSNVMMMI